MHGPTLTPAQAVAFIVVIAALFCTIVPSVYAYSAAKAVVLAACGIALVLAVYFHLEVTK